MIALIIDIIVGSCLAENPPLVLLQQLLLRKTGVVHALTAVEIVIKFDQLHQPLSLLSQRFFLCEFEKEDVLGLLHLLVLSFQRQKLLLNFGPFIRQNRYQFFEFAVFIFVFFVEVNLSKIVTIFSGNRHNFLGQKGAQRHSQLGTIVVQDLFEKIYALGNFGSKLEAVHDDFTVRR
jgi:hypothetical protein